MNIEAMDDRTAYVALLALRSKAFEYELVDGTPSMGISERGRVVERAMAAIDHFLPRLALDNREQAREDLLARAADLVLTASGGRWNEQSRRWRTDASRWVTDWNLRQPPQPPPLSLTARIRTFLWGE